MTAGNQHVLDCHTMEKDLGMWCNVLRDCAVVDVPTYVGKPWFERCPACRKKKNPKECSGGTVHIDRGQRLKFPPTEEGLVPELAVRTVRNGPGVEAVAEHSVEVYVRDGMDSKLVHFSRVDLGRGIAEPRFHLQFGGCADEGSFHPKAGCLRWPTPLYDFVLASELVLYTFYRDAWEKHVLGKSEAIHLVREAEHMYLRSLMDRLRTYMDTPPVGQTFLAVSCTSHHG